MDDAVNPLAETFSRWRQLAAGSARLLEEQQHRSGAWPACPTFAPYRFSWFRDGSFIADGARAGGLGEQADRFHRWCADVLRREQPAVDRVVERLAAGAEVDDATYLPARYNLDGSRQLDDWWNFQVDGYGTWLWALERHLAGAAPADDLVAPVETAVRYLVATGRGTCRDWWEENRDRTHVATLAGVAAGLRAAVRMSVLPAPLRQRATEVADAAVADILRDGVSDGHLVKWLGNADVDGSLLSVAAVYDVLPVDDPIVRRTVEEVEARLAPEGGGVHRYDADTFYGGGQWPVLACLLAIHHARAGDPERAAARLDWVVSTADEDLLLPEQVPPMLAPGRLAEWEERWGPSAHPLLWSHGMFLSAVEAYGAAR